MWGGDPCGRPGGSRCQAHILKCRGESIPTWGDASVPTSTEVTPSDVPVSPAVWRGGWAMARRRSRWRAAEPGASSH